jgi:hypothetical protein
LAARGLNSPPACAFLLRAGGTRTLRENTKGRDGGQEVAKLIKVIG